MSIWGIGPALGLGTCLRAGLMVVLSYSVFPLRLHTFETVWPFIGSLLFILPGADDCPLMAALAASTLILELFFAQQYFLALKTVQEHRVVFAQIAVFGTDLHSL